MDAFADTRRLGRLAGAIAGGVLLLGHPNKAGDEFSGSDGPGEPGALAHYRRAESRYDGVADPDARRLTKASRLAGQSCAICSGHDVDPVSPRPVRERDAGESPASDGEPIRAALDLNKHESKAPRSDRSHWPREGYSSLTLRTRFGRQGYMDAPSSTARAGARHPKLGEFPPARSETFRAPDWVPWPNAAQLKCPICSHGTLRARLDERQSGRLRVPREFPRGAQSRRSRYVRYGSKADFRCVANMDVSGGGAVSGVYGFDGEIRS